MLFEGTRSIDWLMLIIEALVLVLIASDMVIDAKHRRETRKRQSLLAARVSSLSEMMNNGQKLQKSIPDPHFVPRQETEAWMKAAKVWSGETHEFLSGHSPRAASAFALVTDSSDVDAVIYPDSGPTFVIGGDVREAYQRLLSRMNNLRSIMEKPEAYF